MLRSMLPLISLSTAKTHYFMSSNNLDACFINVKANSMIANKKGFMRDRERKEEIDGGAASS